MRVIKKFKKSKSERDYSEFWEKLASTDNAEQKAFGQKQKKNQTNVDRTRKLQFLVAVAKHSFLEGRMGNALCPLSHFQVMLKHSNFLMSKVLKHFAALDATHI